MALDPRLAALLSGGGAPPDGAGLGPGGPPPPMMGGGGPEGPPPSIQLPGAGPDQGGGGGGIPGQPDNPSSAEALKGAIEAVDVYLHAEKDDQDKALGAKILAQLHQLQGNRAKEQDAAMGVSPAVKMVRRQAQGQ